MHVFLTGMPASGKTTLGKAVARQVGVPFVDLDHRIEESENRTIKSIFEQDGESYFRQVEHDQLVKLLDEPDAIVATGGGTPCFHDGQRIMNSRGICIYLRIPLNTLKKRSLGYSHRPLLGDDTVKGIESLFEHRKSIYEQASYTYETLENVEVDAENLTQLILKIRSQRKHDPGV